MESLQNLRVPARCTPGLAHLACQDHRLPQPDQAPDHPAVLKLLGLPSLRSRRSEATPSALQPVRKQSCQSQSQCGSRCRSQSPSQSPSKSSRKSDILEAPKEVPALPYPNCLQYTNCKGRHKFQRLSLLQNLPPICTPKSGLRLQTAHADLLPWWLRLQLQPWQQQLPLLKQCVERRLHVRAWLGARTARTRAYSS